MIEIVEHITNYLNSLDWTYILTFIIISHGLNHYKTKGFFYKILKIKIATRYRVLIIGLVYAIALYCIRGYEIKKIECLLHSFAFALVFHKLILQELIRYARKGKTTMTSIEKEYYDRF